MEKFETEDKIYNLQANQRKKDKINNNSNFVLYIIIILQIIIFAYFFNYIKNLEIEIKYLIIKN